MDSPSQSVLLLLSFSSLHTLESTISLVLRQPRVSQVSLTHLECVHGTACEDKPFLERAAWEKSGKEERASFRVTLVCVARGSLLPSPASLLEPFPALSFSQVLPHFACRHHSMQTRLLGLCLSRQEVPGRSARRAPSD